MSRKLIRRVLFAVLLSLTACDEVVFIEQVVVVNETDYLATVEVRGEDGGWLNLATVSAHETHEVKQVIDRGPSWTFGFSYGTHDPVELTLSKEELVAAGWRVEVPVEFEEKLRAEGISPPP